MTDASFLSSQAKKTDNLVNSDTAITPVLGFNVVKECPHDRAAYTQGLVYDEGLFYEGTGIYGQSTLRLVDPDTGTVLKKIELGPGYFGEGVVLFRDRVIQLTWRENAGFVYDKDSLDWIANFYYPTEGWGITTDRSRLIMSDGTSSLYFLDPESFERTGSIAVSDQGSPVSRLNELEYIKGEIYANVWPTDRIAIISPRTGQVRAWVDLKGLLPNPYWLQGAEVLNGIAYDDEAERLFVTGKLWPKIFEIRLAEKAKS
ncbi:MAG: glutaminyl-peptide cyclotransferase [Methanotrichaceae archaeon]